MLRATRQQCKQLKNLKKQQNEKRIKNFEKLQAICA
jgi:hypothetical protein